MTFAALGLSKKSLVALEREGFEAPTPIQAQAIPPALQGKDVVGSAATGTGKTLAFVLPILERLEGNFDLPHVPEDYVHRIGRTARMEASGRASSFASPEEHDLLRGIEKFTRKTVERAAVPREHDAFRDELKRRAEMAPPGRQVQRHHRRRR